MKNQFLKTVGRLSIVVIGLVISACGLAGQPSQPVQIMPAATPVPAIPFLDIFPIYPGTAWTFEQVNYEGYPDPNQIITVTYQIRETVSETQIQGSSYVAHIKGQKTLLTKDPGWVEPDDSKTYEFWYVLKNGAVYKTQQAPDPANLQDSAQLLYQLPLAEGARWCPGTPGMKTVEECQFAGQYTVLGMQPVQSKIGLLDGCYQIQQFFNDGIFFSSFCPGIGPAGGKYDHAGTRFGFTLTLTAFTKGQAPAGVTVSMSTPIFADRQYQVIKTCTVEGCGRTFIINLSGSIPHDFVLTAKGPDSVTAQAHCIKGQNSDPSDFSSLPFQPGCGPDQVGFTGFSPTTVTIQATWGNQSMTLVAVPVYETLLPNGPGCDPACRVGSVSLNFK